MSFNEMNTIENALRDHLLGSTDTDSGELHWKYVSGEDLVLHGKQPQDVFVDTWLKEFLCRQNKPLGLEQK